MTISKARGKYSVDNDPPHSKTVTVGVTLVTVETETIIQDGRAIELSVDDEVVYTSVPYEVAVKLSANVAVCTSLQNGT